MQSPFSVPFFRLPSDPGARGRWMGRAAGPVLRRRVAAAETIRRRQRLAPPLIAARVREFRRRLARLAPDWLAEAAGIARGAGVDLDGLLMLNCLPPGFYPAPALHCTSFVSVDPDEVRLFKIRDERNHVQAFWIYPLPSGAAIQAGADIGNLGLAHAVSSAGLAGANNTGSHTNLVPDAPRLNDCHILRYLVERARSVDEIPGLFERLLDTRAAGGAGAGRGAIYLFADARRGLLLETTAADYAARFVDRGRLVIANHFLSPRARSWMSRPPNRNTLARKARMEALLGRAGRRPALEAVWALSRDRAGRPHALCNDDRAHFWMTLSAQLQVIPRARPGTAVNYVCCGNTRHSLYLPVPFAARECYGPLLDGRFYALADRLYRAAGCRWVIRGPQRAFERRVLAGLESRAAMEAAYALLRQAAAAGQPRG